MTRPPSKRFGEDGPLATIFMLGLMLAITGGGVWLATREKPGGPAGFHRPDSGGESRPKPSGASGGNTPRFVEAFKRLPQDAVALQRAADEEVENALGALGVADRAEINRILGRDVRSRDAYTDAELALLRKHGLGTWVRAQAVNWAHDDPAFPKVGEMVWNRSSRPKDSEAVIDMAAKWGEMSRVGRLDLFQALQAVDSNSRELTSAERSAVVAFAGEDYLAGGR
jgi:hypothetical protein